MIIVTMFVGARIWSKCDLKMHSQICSEPDIGVPQYNSGQTLYPSCNNDAWQLFTYLITASVWCNGVTKTLLFSKIRIIQL